MLCFDFNFDINNKLDNNDNKITKYIKNGNAKLETPLEISRISRSGQK